MQKPWIVIAATAAIAACATWAFAFTSGPSVSTGSNPLRTLAFTFTFPKNTTPLFQAKQVFEVPPGQTLVITDLQGMVSPPSDPKWAYNSCGGSGWLAADGQVLVRVLGGATDGPRSLRTGVAIASGSKVELSMKLNAPPPSDLDCPYTLVATGYLMKN